MKQYIVDAFTKEVFGGNPAAVCVSDKELPEKLMLDIAKENNLSETAFAVKTENGYNLRWFTPECEVDLCGHATLGTSFVIMNYYEPDADEVSFDTLSGKLTVVRKGDLYEITFPAYELRKVPVTPEMADAIGAVPKEAYMGRDLLCVFEDSEIIRSIDPDSAKVKALDGLILHVTAPGKDVDCVSRSFAPKLAIKEDPVCGSGHCHIVPYWAERLGKSEISAYQASPRGGYLYCRMNGENVIIAGNAVLYSEADIKI